MSDVIGGRRRDRHDIILDILRSATKRIRKTNMYIKPCLSSIQGERYLPALEKGGFIAEEAGLWKTTGKGLHVMEPARSVSRLAKKPHELNAC